MEYSRFASGPPGFAQARHLKAAVATRTDADYFRHAPHANDLHRFFELDSPRNFLHTRITSQPALFASPAKLLFACQPCCGAQFVLTPLISTTI